MRLEAGATSHNPSGPGDAGAQRLISEESPEFVSPRGSADASQRQPSVEDRHRDELERLRAEVAERDEALAAMHDLLNTMVNNIVNEGHKHQYLALASSITHVGEKNIPKNQFEIIMLKMNMNLRQLLALHFRDTVSELVQIDVLPPFWATLHFRVLLCV